MSEDSNVTPFPERKPNGQFQKGQSGNPGGKAKSTPQEVQDYYQSNALKVAKKLVEMCVSDTTPASARVSAIKEFNERYAGKAPASTVVKVTDGEVEFDTSELSKEALREIAKLAGKAGGA